MPPIAQAEAATSTSFTTCLHTGQIMYSPFACEYFNTTYSLPQEVHGWAIGLSHEAKLQSGYFEHP